MRIKVEFSEDSTMGYTDTDKIDVSASLIRFAEALTNSLHVAYPKAEIEVAQSINDRVQVDGRTDHDEAPWVSEIVGKVWNGDGWLEYKDES